MNSLVPIPFPGAQSAGSEARYDALMDVLHDRVTVREFDHSYKMPRAHIEMILDAATLAPSGANAQPWHYLVVTSPHVKRIIADHVAAGHTARGRATGRFHKIDYTAMGHAPGFIVVLLDPRMTWAFPGLMDGSELDQQYHAHAERILLQSVAASTTAAHFAATALGYQTWWVSAHGQDDTMQAIARELGVPPDLRITDFFLFGPSLLPPVRRWKKSRAQVTSWDRFDMANFKTVEQIDDWLSELRQTALDSEPRYRIAPPPTGKEAKGLRPCTPLGTRPQTPKTKKQNLLSRPYAGEEGAQRAALGR
jgi:5,6-dimethylbenzimidazole synthase